VTTAKTRKNRYGISVLFCALLSTSLAAGQLPTETTGQSETIESVHRYNVEIIVFEYGSGVASSNESFEEKQPAPPRPVLSDPNALAGIRVGGDNREPDTETAIADPPEANRATPAALPPDDLEIDEIPSLAAVEFRLLEPQEMTMAKMHQRLLTLDSYRPVLWSG